MPNSRASQLNTVLERNGINSAFVVRIGLGFWHQESLYSFLTVIYQVYHSQQVISVS